MLIITEKQENKKQVLTLNEIEKRKVVEHNSLITSIAKMEKTPLKMFELAVSCINTENPPKDNTIYLSKKELFSFFKVFQTMINIVALNKLLRKCKNKLFFKSKKKKKRVLNLKVLCLSLTLNGTDYNDEVKIEFHRELLCLI
ncbi:RepB family plasmid replication initiator protein [Lactococcus cremoris]|uniref:RepB family plasmid replication initiator protein n=1 Tax=Lactococcus lactis subsp. cremoris TaxID=1359 RepID=UPI002FC74D1A